MACRFVALCIPSARLGAQGDEVGGRRILGLGAAGAFAVHHDDSLVVGALLLKYLLHISVLHIISLKKACNNENFTRINCTLVLVLIKDDLFQVKGDQ